MFNIVLEYIVSTLSCIFAGVVTLLKRWLKLETTVKCCCQNRVRGKVVVVTGSSSGIGYITALNLAERGAVVYLACRNHKNGQDCVRQIRCRTGNPNVHFIHLDLTDFSSVHAFVQAFLKCEQRLDALVNNAGVFHHPPCLTVDALEITYQTNYLGVFLLTSLLLSAIQQSQAGRIIFVSSEAHKLVSVDDVAAFTPKESTELKTFIDHAKNYGISKLAVHLFAQYLTRAFPEVLVSLVDPGNVWTPIFRHSWQSWRELSTRVRCYLFMRSAEEGAQSTIHAVNTPHAVSGQYINSCLKIEEQQRYDAKIVVQLMTNSSVLVGLQHNSSL